MRDLVVERREWKRRDRHHQAEPATETIDDEVRLVTADGEVIAVQALLPETDDLALLSRILRFGEPMADKGGKMREVWDRSGKDSQPRLSGIRYEQRTFGYTAPAPLRRRFGSSPSATMREFPLLSATLDRLTAAEWGVFQQWAPDGARAHLAAVEPILDDWRMAGTPFTSGIINSTAALPYHRDSGNLAGSWSMMLAVRDGIDGGAIDLPEWGVTLGIPHRSVTFFDGQGSWHGVTPLVTREHARRAYRFTMVVYAKSGFATAGPLADEAHRAKMRATHHEPLK